MRDGNCARRKREECIYSYLNSLKLNAEPLIIAECEGTAAGSIIQPPKSAVRSIAYEVFSILQKKYATNRERVE
jgi:hypothetical protein